MSIVHDHNTSSKKQLSFEDALEKMEGNILEQISNLNAEVKSMKDESLNMKDVILKRYRMKINYYIEDVVERCS